MKMINRFRPIVLTGFRLFSFPFNCYIRAKILEFLIPDKILQTSECCQIHRPIGLKQFVAVGSSDRWCLPPVTDGSRSKELVEMEGTVFAPSLEGMKGVRNEQGEMLTKPFLDVCKLILPVIDKFGAAMALVKTDVGGNITRLETKYSSDPSKYEYLYSMVQDEVNSKTAKASSSCTNGLLWLTRAMDFLVELFRNLLEHPDWSMSQACTDSYGKTLKKWHGWFASSSFSLAMKLAPDRKKFMEVIGGSGDINSDIDKFCTTFPPLLQENHKFLVSVGLDDLKSS